MNKKGFTLVELLAVITIMSLIMAIAFPAIDNLIENNKRKKYESYEKIISEYAKAFFEDRAQTGTLKLNEIKDTTENNELGGLDSSCNGYVDLTNYKAYIQCDEYETEGFNSDYLY